MTWLQGKALESAITTALEDAGLELSAELRTVRIALSEIPGVSGVVFDIRAEQIFASWGTSVVVLAEDGLRECPIQDHLLFNGVRPLLAPKHEFPIGRSDILGIDTTPAVETITRTIAERVCAAWKPLETERGQLPAFAGRCDWESTDDGFLRGWVLDFASGEWDERRWRCE